MKRSLSLLLFAFCSLLMTKAAFATTWYVRPDGGTRYSSSMTSGQCDGQGDAAYSGIGNNQHCAFKDVRSLWATGNYNVGTAPDWGWVIAGGDTVIIRGSIGTGVSYRVGWSNPNTAQDSSNMFWGIAGDPYDSFMPAPPSGTASQHTRILGENYGACSSASAKTQLHGGYALHTVINMVGASYVDLACLDITDFSACAQTGSTSLPCNKNLGQLSDFAAIGINWDDSATHDSLTNVHIHGLASDGMKGPTGDGTVFNYLDIIGNAFAGWDSDGGTGNQYAVGVGSLLVQNFNFSWNGCTEEYPMVDALPYKECTDDNNGGYGDAFGTATQPSQAQGWQVHFDQGTVSYNTQDGLDALHLIGPTSSMTITRVLAYGNMGQQIKIGGAHGTAENNLLITNCNAMRGAIPGTPAGYNNQLSDFCRAADTGIEMTVGKGAKTTFDNNTIYSASATGIEIDCDTSNGSCDSTSLIDFRNNIFLGFQNNPANGYTGQYDTGTLDYSNPVYNSTSLPLLTMAGSVFSNNLFFHGKSNFTCATVGQTNGLCVDPQLTDETWHNYGYPNATPLAGSPVIGAAASLAAITIDLNGASRGSTPTIGAVEVAGVAASSNPVSTTQPVTTPTAPATPTTPGTPATPAKPSTPVVPAGPVATQFTLSVSKGPNNANPLILTATVKATAGTKAPTGSVVIFTSAHWPLAMGVLNASGSVSFQVPAALASQTVFGSYSGNSSFKASTSAMLSGPAALASVTR